MQTNPSTVASPRLATGERVKVFRDPLTRTDAEGEAVLVERQSHHNDPKGLELWLVRFSSVEPAYSRLVHPDDLVGDEIKAAAARDERCVTRTQRVNELVARVRFGLLDEWQWRIEEVYDDYQNTRGHLLSATFTDADGVGVSTRKWYVSNHATDSEVVQTALACALIAVEYEAREQFLVDGKQIYGPHWKAEQLLAAFPGEDELDRRKEAS